MNILLDNQPTLFNDSDLPMFIHGADGSGASFFSVILSVHYFQAGLKLIFFTAFPMARYEFLKQVGEDNSDVGIIETENDIENLAHKRALIVLSGDQELFIRTLQIIPDIEERVIFVKNVEEYRKPVFDEALKYDNVIFSGDWDRVDYGKTLLTKKYSSYLYFSKPQFTNIEMPVLEKRVGYFEGGLKRGLVTLELPLK